ncbi:hypothetical protein FHS18_003298 [Paenibacillus phyllosphaerae]|uniref:Uncharacterized protein n=1 Tax=Paenibacillus phyllosphaerae TaxID=274593 RepID=A0A7W5AYQ8_9BACL|nr:hypothetical protein [Paenibacillus phyllosphaerae]MBB3111230.1 hypothetical protein [Paenibacillus phyllosphaerae]
MEMKKQGVSKVDIIGIILLVVVSLPPLAWIVFWTYFTLSMTP